MWELRKGHCSHLKWTHYESRSRRRFSCWSAPCKEVRSSINQAGVEGSYGEWPGYFIGWATWGNLSRNRALNWEECRRDNGLSTQPEEGQKERGWRSHLHVGGVGQWWKALVDPGTTKPANTMPLATTPITTKPAPAMPTVGTLVDAMPEIKSFKPAPISSQEVQRMEVEQVAKALETSGWKKYCLPHIKETIANPLTKDIITAKSPPKFVVPPMTAYDGKINPWNYLWKHVISLSGWSATEEIQCLLFPGNSTGMAASWFHSLELRSTQSFKQLKEKFLEWFAWAIRIKRSRMELLLWNRRRMNHCVDGMSTLPRLRQRWRISRRENMASFQRGLCNEDFLKSLVIDPPARFADIAAKMPG